MSTACDVDSAELFGSVQDMVKTHCMCTLGAVMLHRMASRLHHVLAAVNALCTEGHVLSEDRDGTMPKQTPTQSQTRNLNWGCIIMQSCLGQSAGNILGQRTCPCENMNQSHKQASEQHRLQTTCVPLHEKALFFLFLCRNKECYNNFTHSGKKDRLNSSEVLMQVLVVYLGDMRWKWLALAGLLPFQKHRQEKVAEADSLIAAKRLTKPILFHKALKVTAHALSSAACCFRAIRLWQDVGTHKGMQILHGREAGVPKCVERHMLYST